MIAVNNTENNKKIEIKKLKNNLFHKIKKRRGSLIFQPKLILIIFNEFIYYFFQLPNVNEYFFDAKKSDWKNVISYIDLIDKNVTEKLSTQARIAARAELWRFHDEASGQLKKLLRILICGLYDESSIGMDDDPEQMFIDFISFISFLMCDLNVEYAKVFLKFIDHHSCTKAIP